MALLQILALYIGDVAECTRIRSHANTGRDVESLRGSTIDGLRGTYVGTLYFQL